MIMPEMIKQTAVIWVCGPSHNANVKRPVSPQVTEQLLSAQAETIFPSVNVLGLKTGMGGRSQAELPLWTLEWGIFVSSHLLLSTVWFWFLSASTWLCGMCGHFSLPCYSSPSLWGSWCSSHSLDKLQVRCLFLTVSCGKALPSLPESTLTACLGITSCCVCAEAVHHWTQPQGLRPPSHFSETASCLSKNS